METNRRRRSGILASLEFFCFVSRVQIESKRNNLGLIIWTFKINIKPKGSLLNFSLDK